MCPTVIHHLHFIVIPDLMCEYCDFKTIHADSLKGHIAALHTGNLGYKCDECGKSFYKRYFLDHHKKTHSKSRSCICDECGAAFLNEIQLRSHINFVHSKKFAYECAACTQKFKNREHIRRHILVHSGM